MALARVTSFSSQKPDDREGVEDGKSKWPVGLGRIVGERADDAVERLHYRHGDTQNCKCATGTNADCEEDRQQQGDASRSCITGEGVASAAIEQTCKGKTCAYPSTEERHDGT